MNDRGPHDPDGPRDPVRPPGDGEGEPGRKEYTYEYGYARWNGAEHRRGGRRLRVAHEGEAGGGELQRRDPAARQAAQEPPGVCGGLGGHPGRGVPGNGGRVEVGESAPRGSLPNSSEETDLRFLDTTFLVDILRNIPAAI